MEQSPISTPTRCRTRSGTRSRSSSRSSSGSSLYSSQSSSPSPTRSPTPKRRKTTSHTRERRERKPPRSYRRSHSRSYSRSYSRERHYTPDRYKRHSHRRHHRRQYTPTPPPHKKSKKHKKHKSAKLSKATLLLMDRVLTKLDKSPKPKSPQPPSSPKQPTPPPKPTGHMEEMINKYQSQKEDPDPTSDPISEHLVPILKAWWWETPDKDKAKEILASCLRPANADTQKPVLVNEEIFKKIGQPGRDADQPLRYLHNAIVKSASPIVTVWDQLLKAESTIQDLKQATDGQAILTLPDGSNLNLSSLRHNLDLSLQCLGLANSQMITQRRLTMKKHLNPEYHEICSKRNPFTYKLFGDDLRTKIEDINKLNRLASQLTATKPKTTGKHKSPAASNWWRNNNQKPNQNFLQYSHNTTRPPSHKSTNFRGYSNNNNKTYYTQQNSQIQPLLGYNNQNNYHKNQHQKHRKHSNHRRY